MGSGDGKGVPGVYGRSMGRRRVPCGDEGSLRVGEFLGRFREEMGLP